MKKLYLLLPFGLILLNSFSQEPQINEIKFLHADLRNNFRESIGDIKAQENSHTTYKSRKNLTGSIDNEISISKSENSWAIYTAFISDSCTLKEAKKLTEYWRQIVQKAVPDFIEKKINEKTFDGHPRLGYQSKRVENNYEYYIYISHTKISYDIGPGYFVMVTFGRQIQSTILNNP